MRTLAWLSALGMALTPMVCLQARESAPAGAVVTPKDQYDRKISVSPLLVTSTTADGAPIVLPKVEKPEVRMVIVEIPPGVETGWHIHPAPAFGYILSGSITVELEGGKKETYRAGQALAEVVNVRHNGKNEGSEPTRILMTVITEKDLPMAVASPSGAKEDRKQGEEKSKP